MTKHRWPNCREYPKAEYRRFAAKIARQRHSKWLAQHVWREQKAPVRAGTQQMRVGSKSARLLRAAQPVLDYVKCVILQLPADHKHACLPVVLAGEF